MAALITMACLGCSSYEPLLRAALGAEASGMSCGAGGDMQGDAAMDAAPAPTERQTAAVGTATSSTRNGFDCGCGSCHSVSPNIGVAVAVADAPHADTYSDLPALASVDRSPLFPPPQRIA